MVHVIHDAYSLGSMISCLLHSLAGDWLMVIQGPTEKSFRPNLPSFATSRSRFARLGVQRSSQDGMT